jgi:hypothetical protein
MHVTCCIKNKLRHHILVNHGAPTIKATNIDENLPSLLECDFLMSYYKLELNSSVINASIYSK